MAGRGQHYIPQHFLQPFVIPDGNSKLWMYRRGKSVAIPVSKSDAAKKRDFYSQPSSDGSSTLDDLITDYENYLFPKVDSVRGLKSRQIIPSDVIAEIATHLSVRAAFIRGVYTETVNIFFAAIDDAIQRPENYMDFGLLPADSAPPKLEKFLENVIEESEWYKKDGISSRTLSRIGYLHVREEKENLLEGVLHSLSTLQASNFEDPENLIANSHNKVLSEEFAPLARIEQLSKLHWSVVEHKEGSAILPDCVCFGIDHDGTVKPFILMDRNNIRTVILPLSPFSLAVGNSNKNSSFDPKEYNHLAAKVCFDFFLTSQKQPELLKDFPEIGGNIRDDLHDLVADSLSPSNWGLVPNKRSDASSGVDNIVEETQTKKNDQYVSLSLKFIDCANQEKAESVGHHVYHLANQFLSPEVVSFLDGVTFAKNYEEALEKLDRGFKSSSKLKSREGKGGLGVAMPVPVMRNGYYKVRIMARGYIGDLFLSEDEEDYKLAMAAITHSLAGAEFLYIQDKKFPSQTLQPISEPLDNFLMLYAGNIFPTYYVTRHVSHRFESIHQQEAILAEKIAQYFQEVELKRRIYRVDGNLDVFFDDVASKACEILSCFAKLCAARDLLEVEPPVHAGLVRVLTGHGLVNWASLFRKDLSVFYKNLSLWRRYKELFFVNRHLERWLFMFGVLVELQDEGQIYLHVPLESDVEYLYKLQLSKIM